MNVVPLINCLLAVIHPNKNEKRERVGEQRVRWEFADSAGHMKSLKRCFLVGLLDNERFLG